jgi:diguanylate cyclase (GGDEF)-like protein/PAS domain S-box-containing protein
MFMRSSIPSPLDFFNLSPGLCCVINTHGMITRVNPAWQQLFGDLPRDVAQNHLTTGVHPQDVAETRLYFKELARGKPTTPLIHRRRGQQGDYRWLKWEIVAVPEVSSLFYRQMSVFYAVATDITTEKQREATLQDSEERFQLALQGANHGLWDWDLRTNEIYFSPRWKSLLGYQPDEIANHLDVLLEHVHPADFTDMWGTIETYLDKRCEHYESVYRMRCKSGVYIWVLAQAAALWDENDQPYRMVGTYVDITPYKDTQRALQESENLLNAIFEVAQIGICVIDEQDNYLQVNPAYCKLYGYTASELLKQPFSKVKKHDYAPTIYQNPALEPGNTLKQVSEWCVENKQGDLLDVEITVGNLLQPNGRQFSVITVSDITQRKRNDAERNRLFNLSIDMQSIIDFNGYLKEINSAWEKTLGWTKAELLAKPYLNFVHPYDLQDSKQMLDKLKQGRSVLNFENRFLCKSGSYKWLSWNVYPLVESQTLYSITRDVTQQKQIEQRIAHQQQFIQLIVDSVQHFIFIKDQLGKFIFVNKTFTELLSTQADLLVQRELSEVHAVLSKEQFEFYKQMRGLDYEGDVINSELCVTVAAQTRYFQLTKQPFVQNSQEILLLVVGTDITERRQQEEALRRSETRYRAIVQEQTDLVCRFLPDGTLTFANEAYCHYFNRCYGELIGQSFSLCAVCHQGDFLNHLAQLTPENPVASIELRSTASENSTRWQQWNNRAMFNDQRQAIEYQAVGRDITQRKLAEEALSQSEERLRIIISAAPVILYALNNHKRFSFSRGRALQALNLKDDEVVGLSAVAVCKQLGIPEHIHSIDRALLGEELTCVITLPNIIFEVNYTPLLDNQQQIMGVIGVAIDITKRHSLELQLKEAVAELETILDNSMIGIAYVKQSQFVWVNRKFEHLLRYDENELRGKPFKIMYPSRKNFEQTEERINSLFKQNKSYDEGQLVTTKDGDVLWARLAGRVVDPEELTKGSIWMMEDITLQKQAEQNLRLAATVFETTVDGILITDLQNHIQRINPAFTKITGYLPEELQGKKTSFLASGRHGKDFYKQMWQHIHQTGHWQGEIWNRKKNGEIYVAWVSISIITDDMGNPLQYMAIISDISRLHEGIETVRYLANYDSLTQLPNRLLFHDNLMQAQVWARRHNQSFALMFIDLDGFKPVNDSMGHAVGDELLQGVAQRLLNCIRETDSCARLGGDEFTVILTEVEDLGAVPEVAERILYMLHQPFLLANHEVTISASIGIALYPQDSGDADNLLQCADLAMYESKRLGKGRYCFYKKLGANLGNNH